MSWTQTADHNTFDPEKLKKLNIFETSDMFCDVYCISPGQSQRVHAHANATKFYYVLSGTVEATIGEETRAIEEGMLAWATPGQVHGVHNKGDSPARLLVVMAPNPNAEKAPA